jgi:hypothetical protein
VEAAEARDQPAVCEGRQHGQAQHVGLSAEGHDAHRRLVQVVENGVRVAQEAPAGIRQHKTLAHAVEQVDAEPVLQLPDRAADRTLRQAKMIGRAHRGAEANTGTKRLKF